MAKLRLVIGLPASGKSRYVGSVKAGYQYVRSDWGGWNNQGKREELVQSLQADRDCLIESARFTNRKYLDQTIDHTHSFASPISLTFFQNDPLQCIRLALLDRDRSKQNSAGSLARISEIIQFSRLYRPQSHPKVEDWEVFNVHGSKLATPYVPEEDSETTNLLRRIEEVISIGEKRLRGTDFESDRMNRADYRHREKKIFEILERVAGRSESEH